MILGSLWFLKEKDKNQATAKKWVILAAIAFVLSGMAGLMEKIHQSTDGRSEKAMFVFIACLCMLLFSVFVGFSMRKKDTKKVEQKTLLVMGTGAGTIIGFYSLINLTLAGELNSMIYYPIANGGAMLITVIVSSARWCIVFGSGHTSYGTQSTLHVRVVDV